VFWLRGPELNVQINDRMTLKTQESVYMSLVLTLKKSALILFVLLSH